MEALDRVAGPMANLGSLEDRGWGAAVGKASQPQASEPRPPGPPSGSSGVPSCSLSPTCDLYHAPPNLPTAAQYRGLLGLEPDSLSCCRPHCCCRSGGAPLRASGPATSGPPRSGSSHTLHFPEAGTLHPPSPTAPSGAGSHSVGRFADRGPCLFCPCGVPVSTQRSLGCGGCPLNACGLQEWEGVACGLQEWEGVEGNQTSSQTPLPTPAGPAGSVPRFPRLQGGGPLSSCGKRLRARPALTPETAAGRRPS